MSDTVTLQPVSIVGKRTPPSDEVTLVVRGIAWGGWKEVRITRGIERLPSDFEVTLTEFVSWDVGIEILRGDACVLKIGADVVITGYVDRIVRTIDARQHTVTISGRSKCSDLVDCAAEWPGGQIVGASVLEVAQQLVLPYSNGTIKVTRQGDPGPTIPRINLMRGQTPFQIIELLCRFAQLLAYDLPSGDLFLTVVSQDRAASGFREGVNVIRAQFMASVDQRFSEYFCYLQSVAPLKDFGNGSDLIAQKSDELVPRHRRRIIISETSGSVGQEIAAKRAGWEAARRQGRSTEVRLTTDSWRDADGKLYLPNTKVLVELPSLRLASATLTIGEITYRKGDTGTLCDVVLMPGEAFTPQPFDIAQLLPFREAADMAKKVNP